MHANRQEPLDEAHCGDIVAVVGLSDTQTGDTICGEDHPILLEAIEFPAPVMSISIAPESRGDNEKLGEALHHLADEDPTFMVRFDDGDRARPSSPAWANCTWRSSWTA